MSVNLDGIAFDRSGEEDDESFSNIFIFLV